MSVARGYRARQRPTRAQQTRARIVGAVRELLAEGAFQTSTMDAVARRAGVSRATLYQHFRSRVELVDAICETFGANPALVALRETVELPDADAALRETLAHTIRFWAAEDAVLRELYGSAALDPAAQELVARQRVDRRGEMRRLARHLARTGGLRAGLTERDALDALMVLSSYETFRELRAGGRSERAVAAALQHAAECLLRAPQPAKSTV